MEEVVEKTLNSELWHACAGGLVQIPPLNARVYYFPQGHAEHTLTTVDFGALPRFSLIPCGVAAVKYLADPETDEVYAKIRLIPLRNNEPACHEDPVIGSTGSVSNESSNSFAKILTQSDANNGGGFSVPRYCAETIFPRLDYTAEPPAQNVIAKDVHGESWQFRHIYRGTPRRHLLTTGWSAFVNHKKLVAGDSIVFLRAESGKLCIGMRRAKKGSARYSSYFKDGENKVMHRICSPREKGRVRPESVVEAAYLAASGQPFEVVYYPRASTPEYVVKASSVNAALRTEWCSGMKFKMQFESEDLSKICWFTGTIVSVQPADPLRFPSSPWRMLQVAWEGPDQLQTVKCVSPWLVELVSNMPVLHLSPFSPPRRKLRLPHHSDFAFDGQLPMPSFSGTPLGPSSPLCRLPDNITAGIQGARHAQIGVPLSDFQLSNKLQMGLFQQSFLRLDPRAKVPDTTARTNTDGNDNISCVLSIGNCSKKLKTTDDLETPIFVLFGQPILTEQQLCNVAQAKDSARDHEDLPRSFSGAYNVSELSLDTGHCKVFLESEDVGRSLDLSVLGSYEELYKKLENMFRIERSEMPSRVFYRDATGTLKPTGDKPFSEFAETVKRLTIFMKQGNNNAERKLITGLPTAERGLDSSNKTGPLGIIA